jgi:hypothetical protein
MSSHCRGHVAARRPHSRAARGRRRRVQLGGAAQLPGQPRGRLCPRGGCAGRARRPGGRQGLRAARCPQEGEALHGQRRVVLRPDALPRLGDALPAPLATRAGAGECAREAADRLPRGSSRAARATQRPRLPRGIRQGFDPESWQVIVKAHESVRLELAPPVDGALQTVVLILRSPTTCTRRVTKS